ncbi:MAG: ABC transporter ATP-binding protein [Alphaproteobacteria bacterium]
MSKSFGAHKVVDQVSLQLKQGEVLGFLGPNGAGKTTTMRMLSGFLAPDNFKKNQISLDGHDLYDHAIQAKAALGYLPEGAPNWGEFKVAEFLSFMGKAHGLTGAFLQERLDKMRDQLNLTQCWGQSIETLSKGYRRRVCFAAALIHDPKILILDEPTDGLDPNQKDEIRELIRSLARDKAILISTHILEEVEAICARIIILNKGKIVADGTVREIAAQDKLQALDTPITLSIERVFRELTLA